MPLYCFESADGSRIEELFTLGSAPKQIRRDGKTYRYVIGAAAHKMEAETQSPEYQKWFHSEDTQAKIRSGKYEIAGKSHNINQY